MQRVMFTHQSGRKERMERRYAEVLQKLGRGTYMTRDMRATEKDELSVARSKYQDVFGKRAYHGWDSDTIREKIKEASE